MRKLLLILVILFLPSLSWAQCNGLFPPSTVCGNSSLLNNAPPGPIVIPSGTGGVNSAQVNAGTGTAISGTCNTTTALNCTVELAPVATVKSLLTVEISVTDPAFGAKCDGTTDDTTAIQAAINSLPVTGGIVLFPPATCRISNTILVGDGTTSAISTRRGIYLIGRGIPNSPDFWGGGSGNGPKLKWTGSSTVPMVLIQGPLPGWGVQNLFLDCQSTATYGLEVTSASFGDSKNLTIEDCTLGGLYSTSHPLGGYGGAITDSSSIRNVYSTVAIFVSTTASSHGLIFTGEAGASSNTDYNTVNNLIIGFRSNNGQAGIYLGIADSNIFVGVSIAAMQSSHSGIQLDYSVNNTFPLSNIFYGLEDQGGTPYVTVGAPGAGSKNNFVIGPLEANGGIAPNNVAGWSSSVMSPSAHLGGWATYTPSLSCGTATFSVGSARYAALNNTTTVQLDATITGIGSGCTNAISFTLPNTPVSSGGLIGREQAVDFLPVACTFIGASATVSCVKPALQNFAVNNRVVLSGSYESP